MSAKGFVAVATIVFVLETFNLPLRTSSFCYTKSGVAFILRDLQPIGRYNAISIKVSQQKNVWNHASKENGNAQSFQNVSPKNIAVSKNNKNGESKLSSNLVTKFRMLITQCTQLRLEPGHRLTKEGVRKKRAGNSGNLQKPCKPENVAPIFLTTSCQIVPLQTQTDLRT